VITKFSIQIENADFKEPPKMNWQANTFQIADPEQKTSQRRFHKKIITRTWQAMETMR